MNSQPNLYDRNCRTDPLLVNISYGSIFPTFGTVIAHFCQSSVAIVVDFRPSTPCQLSSTYVRDVCIRCVYVTRVCVRVCECVCVCVRQKQTGRDRQKKDRDIERETERKTHREDRETHTHKDAQREKKREKERKID